MNFQAAGRHTRFPVAVDAQARRVRFQRPIPRAQARRGTGILTLTYPGDADTRGQEVRLRAAPRPADLAPRRPTLNFGRLRAAGTISKRARGVVRIQLDWSTGGQARSIELLAPIRNGRWALDQRLPGAVREQIARRDATVHSSTLFTGYLPARMGGEMKASEVRAVP